MLDYVQVLVVPSNSSEDHYYAEIIPYVIGPKWKNSHKSLK